MLYFWLRTAINSLRKQHSYIYSLVNQTTYNLINRAIKMCKNTAGSQCDSYNNSSISTITTQSSIQSLMENQEEQESLSLPVQPRLSRKLMAPEMLTNVMNWFANQGVVRGDAEGLADRLSLGDVKKLNKRKEINSSGLSQLLERRHKRKLGVVV